ncbi:MAG: GNAT family N-acetyltransferase [Pirellulales bacterium]
MSDPVRPVTIRDGRSGDVEAIVQFNQQLAAETESKQLDGDVVRSGVRRALARPSLCRYFLACDSERPVGQAMVTYEWSDWRDGVLWWLQSVYVHPDWRRRGVLRRLHEHILHTARRLPDIRGVRLYVDRDNIGAMEAYRRLGFRAAGYEVWEVDV